MRVIYRGDLDGTVCVAILMEVGLCDELEQAHPKDIQEGKVDITSDCLLYTSPSPRDATLSGMAGSG